LTWFAWLAFFGAITVNQIIKKMIPAMSKKTRAIRKIAKGLLVAQRRANLADKPGLGT
jgi:hypothetical protein